MNAAELAALIDGTTRELRATLSGFRSGLVPERLTGILTEVREPELDAAFARWKAVAQ